MQKTEAKFTMISANPQWAVKPTILLRFHSQEELTLTKTL